MEVGKKSDNAVFNNLMYDRITQEQTLIANMVNIYPDTCNSVQNGSENNTSHKKQFLLPDALLDLLEQVDQAMLDCVKSHSALINVAGQHVLRSGGKRLRASLVLLAAQLGDYHFEKVIHSATAVELIHVASLVHDDLVDEAERRRGVVAIHSHWDHGVALMVGDYFFALASKEMSLAPDPRIISYFSQAVMAICEGELSPVMQAMPLETALAQYYQKIGRKTASLFEAACKAGMASGRGSEDQIELLGQFGYDLGLAFQMIDDILDFTGNESILGKPAGSDLRQGVITLPYIYAVQASSEREKLLSVMDESHDEELMCWAIDEVRRCGVARACEEAYAIMDRALSYLVSFPDGFALQTLHDIAAFVLERDK